MRSRRSDHVSAAELIEVSDQQPRSGNAVGGAGPGLLEAVQGAACVQQRVTDRPSPSGRRRCHDKSPCPKDVSSGFVVGVTIANGIALSYLML